MLKRSCISRIPQSMRPNMGMKVFKSWPRIRKENCSGVVGMIGVMRDVRMWTIDAWPWASKSTTRWCFGIRMMELKICLAHMSGGGVGGDCFPGGTIGRWGQSINPDYLLSAASGSESAESDTDVSWGCWIQNRHLFALRGGFVNPEPAESYFR